MKNEEKKKETKDAWRAQSKTGEEFAKNWNRKIIENGVNPFPSHEYKYVERQAEN